MFNKLKTTTLAAVTAVAATMLGSGDAHAADFGQVRPKVSGGNVNFVQLGNCYVQGYSGNSGQNTALYLSTTSQHWDGQFAGGAVNSWGTILSQTPISIARIATCMQTVEANIVGFFQDGPQLPFLTDPYVGFRFSLQNSTPIAAAGTYEWAFYDTLANVAPTANAGPDLPVASGTAPVTLDGTGSSDPDAGQTLTYAWTAPAGVTLSDPTAASPTFTAPTLAAGDADAVLTFSLIVTDNLGLASVADEVTITVISGPSVAISGGPDAITSTDPFTITAAFSKPVTGFDALASDVIVTNGSATGITGGPTIYTVTITPTGNGDVSITIPVAAAQDSVGNGNSASNTLVIGNQIVEITQEQIAGFMLGRANNLASNQPGLTRFLMGEGCGAFSANATEGSGSINGCVSRGNTWAEITSAWSGDDSYTLGTIGAHGFVNPNLLIGGMVQFDRAEDSANNASGTGYMVGPYFVAKAAEQPLYFEGRLLYGQTNNDISPLGTYTDSFETERWLAQLRATGEYKLQNTTLMPLLGFTYTDDTQKAYTDSLGNTIPGQTVSLMQITAGMDFSAPIQVQTGSLELNGGLSGIYSSSDGAAAAPEFENWRGRTHLGLNYRLENGGTLSAKTFYDGLGTNYESYGASLGFDMKF